MPARPLKATRSDGERSRREILLAATRMATVHGLQHLSIGQLADEVGMSKSGLYAHFGSKEELQLATIELAEQIYDAEVYAPVAGVPPGIEGLLALVDAHLDHMRRGVFPNGCFFDAAAADLLATEGAVRDRVAAYQHGFMGRIRANLDAARAAGDLEGEDLDQLAFDVTAAVSLAHTMLAFYRDPSALDRAAVSVRHRLGVTTSPGAAVARRRRRD